MTSRKKYFLFLIIFSFLIISCNEGSSPSSNPINSKSENYIESKNLLKQPKKIQEKAKEALKFCKEQDFNTDFCILIDMSIHSGKKRFFLFDFKKNIITQQYLVGHGCGEASWSKDETKDNPTFSNENDSHLSSLGKYRLGERGYSNWGVHTKYLMHGLEKTNDNAVKRIIVFHSWELMSDEEVYPKGSPEGWGCPTLSNNAFLEIDPLIKNSEKPVLMWIYN